MPNPIKYSTGSESDALKKGNFYIGTGDVGKGPSNITGYYQGPDVPSGGYVIYLYNSNQSGNLSYHTASNDAELISFTNNLAGQSYTTVNECLVYYAGQTDKVCVNRDYEDVITNGLMFNIDAGFTPSYPKNGTTWYDVGGTNNGTLLNGPTFSNGDIVFDGTDDYVNFGNPTELQITTSAMTMEIFFKTPILQNQSNNHAPSPISKRNHWVGEQSAYSIFITIYDGSGGKLGCYFHTENGTGVSRTNDTVLTDEWIHIVGVYNGMDVRSYRNGILQDMINPLTGNINNIDTPLYMGVANASGSPQNNYRFKGEIPIVRLYNRALSADEVLQNFNAQKGRFGL